MKKRLLSLLTAAVTAFSAMPIFAVPSSAEDNGTAHELFEVNDDNCLVKYRGNETEITVPAGVTSIGEGCFMLNTDLEQVALPEGLTVIERNAFLGCTSLRSVSLSDSVTEIGAGAFGNCLALESLQMPDSLQTIGDSAFSLCISLQAVSLPDGVTEIGSKAFMGCSSLRSVEFPDGLTAIADSTFTGCGRLEAVKLPDGITQIGSNAFSDCQTLTSVSLPESVTGIGSGAFSGCRALPSLDLPSQLTAIPDRLCEYCVALNAVTLPDDITAIGSKAFSGCAVLKDLSLPAGLTSVGADCFSGCDALLSQCRRDGHTVLYDGRLLLGIEGGIAAAEISAGTKLIADSALDSGCLIAVTIPETVQYCGIQSPQYLIEIRGVPGSAAEQFAAEHQIAFSDVNEVKTGTPTEIIYGTDTWSIQNAGYEFGTDYYLTDAARAALQSGMACGGATVDDAWEGECFGLSVSMLLLKAGIYTPEQIQPGARTVSEITSDKAVQSFINFYHFIQYTPELLSVSMANQYAGQAIYQTVKAAKECNTGAPPFLINLRLGHAVIGYGQENGQWEINGESYDGRILIWDPNFPTAHDADADLYYNSETLHCCIPYYHVQCAALDRTPVSGICSDIAVLNAYPYPLEAAGDVNRDGEIRLNDAVLLAHLLSEDTGTEITAAGVYSADCDGDGLIQMLDLRWLLHSLV